MPGPSRHIYEWVIKRKRIPIILLFVSSSKCTCANECLAWESRVFLPSKFSSEKWEINQLRINTTVHRIRCYRDRVCVVKQENSVMNFKTYFRYMHLINYSFLRFRLVTARARLLHSLTDLFMNLSLKANKRKMKEINKKTKDSMKKWRRYGAAADVAPLLPCFRFVMGPTTNTTSYSYVISRRLCLSPPDITSADNVHSALK